MTIWIEVLNDIKNNEKISAIKKAIIDLEEVNNNGNLDEVNMTSDKMIDSLKEYSNFDWDDQLKKSVMNVLLRSLATKLALVGGVSIPALFIKGKVFKIVENALKDFINGSPKWTKRNPEKYMDKDSIDFVKELASKADSINLYHDNTCNYDPRGLENFYSNARESIIMICGDIMTNNTLLVDEKRELFEYMRQKRVITPYQREHMKMILQKGRGCLEQAAIVKPSLVLDGEQARKLWIANFFAKYGREFVVSFAKKYSSRWDMTYPRMCHQVGDMKEDFVLLQLLSHNPELNDKFISEFK